MEPKVGFEPTTDGLRNRCSTPELLRPEREARFYQPPPRAGQWADGADDHLGRLLGRRPAMQQLVVVARLPRRRVVILGHRRYRGAATLDQQVVGADIGQRAEAADGPRSPAGVPAVPNRFDMER